MSKKSFMNTTHVEGYLYNHKLERKITGEQSKNPGTPYIRGSVDIATDKDCLNVVSVYYSYVVEKTTQGKPNNTFATLADIIDGKIKNVMSDGIENAGIVRADSAIALNDFPTQDGTMVAQRRNEGGFLHKANELNPVENQRSTWRADMVITNCIRKEANEERSIPEHMTIKGCVFNFRKDILPVEFTVYSNDAMNYFEGLEASEKQPVFTQVWGEQLSQTRVKKTVIESAFGEPQISETRSTYREFVITGARPEPYDWDTEDTILASELKEMMANREVHLADVKRRNEEWRANKAGVASTISAASVGEFKF